MWTSSTPARVPVYDFENRLAEARQSGTQNLIASYRYDALGRRVEKMVQASGVTTRYILDGVQVVEEFDGNGLWQARYVYEDGIDRPRCMDRADIADVNGNSNTTEVLRFHYHQQALGSVTEVTQPSGAVVEWVNYDVYGKPAIRDRNGVGASQSAVGNPYLFTGRELDPETGLFFYRARHYDSGTGRFLQRDPLEYVDGLSLKTYASNSPSVWTDPFGTDDTPADAKVKPLAKSPPPKEMNKANERIKDAIEIIRDYGPPWAQELLNKLYPKGVPEYQRFKYPLKMPYCNPKLDGNAHGLHQARLEGSGDDKKWGHTITISFGRARHDSMEELIGTLLHELRHAYLYQKGVIPKDENGDGKLSNEEKHPLVDEHGMTPQGHESTLPGKKGENSGDGEGGDAKEKKLRADVWRETQQHEAKNTVKSWKKGPKAK